MSLIEFMVDFSVRGSMHLFVRRVVVSFFLAVLAAMFLWASPKALIFIDNKYFQEEIRQLYGRFVAGEEWSDLPVLPVNMDYHWLNFEKKPLRIGHALGFSGTLLGNQLEALPQAKELQLHVLEVDLWLAEDNSVRCFHGPGDPGPLLEKTCTFDRLLHATEASGEYLVLDIKTDFERTAAQVNVILQEMPSQRRRVVFQLYRPNDVNIFSTFQNLESYPGPIVTAYASRTSLNALALGAKRANIRALTLPLKRQSALDRRLADGLHLFVHPVHTCSDFQEAIKNSYDGIYALAFLRC